MIQDIFILQQQLIVLWYLAFSYSCNTISMCVCFATTAPLVKIKQSIQQLKKEITQMDIRSGVVEHVLLQAKLKDKTSQNKQAHSSNTQDGFII